MLRIVFCELALKGSLIGINKSCWQYAGRLHKQAAGLFQSLILILPKIVVVGSHFMASQKLIVRL